MRAYIHYAMMCVVVSCLYSDALRSTAAAARQGELTNILLAPTKVRFYELRLREKGYDPADLESIKAAAADPKWASARWNALGLLDARMGKEAVPIFRKHWMIPIRPSVVIRPGSWAYSVIRGALSACAKTWPN
jgi:hypothetical protein